MEKGKRVQEKSRNNSENNIPKKRKGLKIFGIIVLILVILLVAIIGFTYFFVVNKLNKIQRVDLDISQLDISEEAEQNLTGYRNIALFAIDSRSIEDYGEGNRSDGIIIASINNETKEVKLVSVYRDTYVQIEGHGLDKITHAYSYGEAPLAISTLNTNLDLNIKEFVTVNFDAVAEAINQLGGVTIPVEEDELQYINSYIRETSKVTGINTKEVTKAGTQVLDGVQAVAYARIRYTSGGDYKRAERMRTVIEAAFNKLKTKSLSEINAFADTILPKIYTNISTGDILAMVPDLTKYKVSESIGWPYETRGITMNAWYGIPVTLESNVQKLHQELFNEQDYTPTQIVKNISNQIINKTGYSN